MKSKQFEVNFPSLPELLNNPNLTLSNASSCIIIKRFSSTSSIVYLCRTLKISRSGYYKWLKRQSKTDPDLIIKACIEEIQIISDRTIGYRRMATYVSTNLSALTNHKKIYRIMKKYNLLSAVPETKKYKIICKGIAPFNNLLDGDFTADLPNKKWCTDITTVRKKEGKLFLSAIEDLHDRFIVSYETGSSQNFMLVRKTIEKALAQNTTASTNPIILHSDQGIQYKNRKYKSITKNYNIKPSMSRKATPTDNAVIESFFATMKKECLHRYTFDTRKQANAAIEAFIFFYNYFRINLKTEFTPYEVRLAG